MANVPIGGSRSIRDFGVAATNMPALNKAALQRAIDWAAPRGAALFVEPSDEPYPVDGGLILKRNVSLVGVHDRRTRHASSFTPKPVGSASGSGQTQPFLTVEGATQVRGLQFWYPRQASTIRRKSSNIRPPSKSHARPAGCDASCLVSTGVAMDFNAARASPANRFFEHLYGYPLGGEFIRTTLLVSAHPALSRQPGEPALYQEWLQPGGLDAVVAARAFTTRSTTPTTPC
jgi:hypothetical protein